MSQLQLLEVKGEKHLYLVKVKNQAGEIRDQWLEKDDINFIDPNFLNLEVAGCSHRDPIPLVSSPVSSPRSALLSINPQSSSVARNVVQPIVLRRSTNRHQSLICEYCNRPFTRPDHLKTHITKLHLGGKVKLRCPFGCVKLFGYKTNLTQHLRKTHELDDVKSLEISTKAMLRAKTGKQSPKRTTRLSIEQQDAELEVQNESTEEQAIESSIVEDSNTIPNGIEYLTDEIETNGETYNNETEQENTYTDEDSQQFQARDTVREEKSPDADKSIALFLTLDGDWSGATDHSSSEEQQQPAADIKRKSSAATLEEGNQTITSDTRLKRTRKKVGAKTTEIGKDVKERKSSASKLGKVKQTFTYETRSKLNRKGVNVETIEIERGGDDGAVKIIDDSNFQDNNDDADEEFGMYKKVD